jgi:hypothetical protein
MTTLFFVIEFVVFLEMALVGFCLTMDEILKK